MSYEAALDRICKLDFAVARYIDPRPVATAPAMGWPPVPNAEFAHWARTIGRPPVAGLDFDAAGPPPTEGERAG